MRCCGTHASLLAVCGLSTKSLLMPDILLQVGSKRPATDGLLQSGSRPHPTSPGEPALALQILYPSPPTWMLVLQWHIMQAIS